MESRVNYTLVGIFVIILGAALIGGILWLTVGTETRFYDTYRVYVRESVAGLNPQASVKYRGVDVGKVSSIALDRDNPERVELLLDIEEGTPVKTDTRAVLVTQGLTGLAYVELTGGSRTAPPLDAASQQPYPVIESGPSLVTRLDNAFTTLVEDFTDLSQRLKGILSADNQAAVAGILVSLETTTGELAARSERIGRTLDDAALALEQTAMVSTELPPLLARVGSAIIAVEEMSRAIATTSRGLETAVLESRRDIAQLAQDTAPEIGALLGELRQLTDVIQRFGQELERNPRMLLFGRQPGQLGPGE
ncbi:MAG: MlaD family protein [Candidatus Competibacteraceae bacterium]|nr:MlaD family protein [Candidatus Competibacteraceae bacterium]